MQSKYQTSKTMQTELMCLDGEKPYLITRNGLCFRCPLLFSFHFLFLRKKTKENEERETKSGGTESFREDD